MEWGKGFRACVHIRNLGLNLAARLGPDIRQDAASTWNVLDENLLAAGPIRHIHDIAEPKQNQYFVSINQL